MVPDTGDLGLDITAKADSAQSGPGLLPLTPRFEASLPAL